MSAPEEDPLLIEGLAVEVIKSAINATLEDAVVADMIFDAPDYLGLSELSDEDWDRLHDLVKAADYTVEVYWR